MNVLLILQGPAYGDEHSYNGLRLAGSLAVVGLVLAHPAMQRLWDTANFGCNGLDGCPLGWVVLQVGGLQV